jgi:hypothetical protein
MGNNFSSIESIPVTRDEVIDHIVNSLDSAGLDTQVDELGYEWIVSPSVHALLVQVTAPDGTVTEFELVPVRTN